jgi:hypothetical protein
MFMMLLLLMMIKTNGQQNIQKWQGSFILAGNSKRQ